MEGVAGVVAPPGAVEDQTAVRMRVTSLSRSTSRLSPCLSNEVSPDQAVRGIDRISAAYAETKKLRKMVSSHVRGIPTCALPNGSRLPKELLARLDTP
jgi:hypothetical protein